MAGSKQFQNNQPITEEEIQQALEKFKAQGGLIKRLPDEVVPRGSLVGGRYSAYEGVLDTTGTGESSS